MSTKQAQSLDLEDLEGMVDRHGLSGVLSMLSDICGEKSAHLCSNWQDTASGRALTNPARFTFPTP